MLTVLDLFSGIGGFSLGLERTGGFKTIAFCEIDPFCRRVLAKHWPGVPIYEDITTADFSGIGADVICGGFPCQDISTAGKRAGITGERSGLWKYLVGAIRVVRPRYAIVENVAALLGNGLDVVLGDLASVGYDCEWHCIPASAVGAPHRRDRWWAVAHTNRRRGFDSFSAQANISNAETFKQWRRGLDELGSGDGVQWCDSYTGIRRAVHGIPYWVDRTHALGNSVVPQIPELIGRAILKAEGLTA